ncbi:MAG: hypothetical protein GX587_01060 [Bacteroidales bacterium]|nr:hypothetical protein [Bacteroidales bacterium]
MSNNIAIPTIIIGTKLIGAEYAKLLVQIKKPYHDKGHAIIKDTKTIHKKSL